MVCNLHCIPTGCSQGYADKKHAYIAAQGIYNALRSCTHSRAMSDTYLSLSLSPLPCLSCFLCVCVPGPTEVTVERFWQMVWEHQLTTIVMLTRCVEDGKVCFSLLWLAASLSNTLTLYTSRLGNNMKSVLYKPKYLLITGNYKMTTNYIHCTCT